jgi:hypothetical protein
MATEIALQDTPISRAIEKGTPCFQFADARRRFLRMEFCHSPVAKILAATHRVGKVNSPVIPVIYISHRGGYAALGHDRVCLAQEGFRNESHLYSGRRSLNRSAQASAPRTNNKNIVFVGDVFGH